jgi:hypothetical protein
MILAGTIPPSSQTKSAVRVCAPSTSTLLTDRSRAVPPGQSTHSRQASGRVHHHSPPQAADCA